MKRIIIFIFIIGLLGMGAWAAKPQLTVGIDQGTKGEWDEIIASFEKTTGINVSLYPYPASSLGQQIVLSGITRSGKLNLVMVHKSWGTSLSRYLADLGQYADELLKSGASPVYIEGRLLGAWIPFAPDWFLGVLGWPEDPNAAIALLETMGTGVTTSTQTSKVSPQGVVKTFTTTKTARAAHNPKIDGSLETLLEAAKATVGAMAADIMGKLPPTVQTALSGLARIYGIPFDPKAGTITVVLKSWNPRTTANNVAALGVNRSAIKESSSLVKVTIPLSELPTLAAQLAGVAFIRPPYTPYPLAVTGEGVAAIGADAYHSAGITGSGVKVAIIDLGFAGLSQAQARGDIPYSVVQRDFTGTGLTTGISHGTAVAEIVHEIAPDAQLYLIKIADEVDLDQAVTYCLNNGIDIINHSLGWYNTNFYDGTGTIADIATRAIQGGILWVNAAGNEAQSHWEGTFTDANSDTWLDQSLTFYATAGSSVIIYMTWNDWPQASSDYDLYLYNPANNLVTSSTKHQTGTEEPTESIQTTVSSTGTYTIRVKGSGSKKIEIYNLYQHITPAIAASSILAPGNVADVVTVGAVDWAHYTTGPIEPYSSQGPTNDGRIKPDLVAPDNVTTGTSPYTSFAGTSGAAPEVTGAAALLLSADPSLTAAQLRARLLSQTVAMGSQYIYGQGRLVLASPTPTNQPPSAAFSYSPSNPTPGTWVHFDASSSSDPDGTIVAYVWDFGDGGTGNGVSVYHQFTNAGTYTVRLTVTDDDGATNTASKSVGVGAVIPPPVADAGGPYSGIVGQPITLDGSGSTGSISQYLWNFGDGTSGQGVTVTHTYSASGTYTVTLTVIGTNGQQSSDTAQVTISSPTVPLSVQLSLPKGTYQVGESIVITYTVNRAAYVYICDADASGKVILLFPSYLEPNNYVSPGTHTLPGRSYTLRVSLPAGTETLYAFAATSPLPNFPTSFGSGFPVLSYNPSIFRATVRQTMQTQLPAGEWTEDTLSFTVASAPTTGTLRVSSSPQGASVAIDGTPVGTTPLQVSVGAGIHTVVLTRAGYQTETRQVNILAGQTTYLNVLLTPQVQNQPPVVSFTYSPSSPTAGETVHFNGSGSYDPDGSIVSYGWNFGDGHTGSGVTVNHAYANPGNYTVRLTVTDNGGASRTAIKSISIAAAPSFPALRAYWAFNAGSGSVAHDSSGNGNNGTIHGATWTGGSPDGSTALSFDGSGDYVAVPASASLAITGELTVEAWVAPASVSGTQVLVRANNRFQLALEGGAVSFAVYTNTWKKVIGATTLNTGTWYHVAGVYTGHKLRVYLNGNLEGEFNVTGAIGQGQPTAGVTIGAQAGGAQGFIGKIDEVRIYGDALDPSAFSLPPSLGGNQPPVADFTYTPANPRVGVYVRFQSTSHDPDGKIVWTTWTLGDGAFSVGGAPWHKYKKAGTYTVTLTVRDNDGAEAKVIKKITVSP